MIPKWEKKKERCDGIELHNNNGIVNNFFFCSFVITKWKGWPIQKTKKEYSAKEQQKQKKSICSFGCHHHHRHSSCLFVWISMGKQKKKDCFSNHKGTFKTNKLIFEKNAWE